MIQDAKQSRLSLFVYKYTLYVYMNRERKGKREREREIYIYIDRQMHGRRVPAKNKAEIGSRMSFFKII